MGLSDPKTGQVLKEHWPRVAGAVSTRS